MPSLPRIITVDPTGTVARLVHATIDISEYACRQIDVPTAAEALEEIQLGGGDLIVSALDLEDMSSMTFVEQSQQIKADIGILLLADETDPMMDLTEQRERGFVYLQRPIDVTTFSQVIFAGMRRIDLFEALRKAEGVSGSVSKEYGPVPDIDLDRAGAIIDQLLVDLGAMSIMLLGRDGSITLERGADNFMDRDEVASALLPSIQSNIGMRELVGGDSNVLGFYDGDHRDVYTLSVGLHHLLCIAYHGEKGQREFGMVNRLGRTAAMDLIALLGAEAFMLRLKQPDPRATDELPRRTIAAPRVNLLEDEEPVALERAAEFVSDAPAIEAVHMDAISDDEFDPSFLDQLGSMDESAADDLFSLDNLGDVELNVKFGKTLSDDEARDLGILGS
jgi:hypothetical protein